MPTAQMTLDYGQLLSLVLQLPPDDRRRFSREILGDIVSPLERIIGDMKRANVMLTDAEIREECEAVRSEIYANAS